MNEPSNFFWATSSRFVISGGLAAAVYFISSLLLLRLNVPPILSGVIAYACAFGVGYSLQQHWTFRRRVVAKRSMPRYFLVQVCCALLSAMTIWVATRLHASSLVASVAATIVVGTISYFASSRWVFVRD